MRMTTWIVGGFVCLMAGCSSWKGVGPPPPTHPASPSAVSAEPPASPNVLHIEGGWLPPAAGANAPVELAPDHPSSAPSRASTPSTSPSPAPHSEGSAPHAPHPAARDQRAVDDLVRAYLRIHVALASDKTRGVDTALTEIRSDAETLAASKRPELSSLGKRVAAATPAGVGTLEKTRKEFQGLSRAVVDLVSALLPSAAAVPRLREVYCPMAKAPWLQTGDQVSNPYFGTAMPSCGEFRRTFRGGSTKKGSH